MCRHARKISCQNPCSTTNNQVEILRFPVKLNCYSHQSHLVLRYSFTHGNSNRHTISIHQYQFVEVFPSDILDRRNRLSYIDFLKVVLLWSIKVTELGVIITLLSKWWSVYFDDKWLYDIGCQKSFPYHFHFDFCKRCILYYQLA